ncbi:hypothetical protein L227DRAFT_96565 [Lentinus tigrinus ALCF2SS1-6]|uniref:Uncharacterized protein n=1 Tax=Lentinus tigrinus ALCF2SS1-6 TaxID=1328759 RepID=A0A5C2SAS2_9APHY|nr:hypothetical protein L227DRAFT_96565 [Lentinus tigrinus ALCF2SS1-6]
MFHRAPMSSVANVDAGGAAAQEANGLEALVADIKDLDIEAYDDITGIRDNIGVLKRYKDNLKSAIFDIEYQDNDHVDDGSGSGSTHTPQASEVAVLKGKRDAAIALFKRLECRRLDLDCPSTYDELELRKLQFDTEEGHPEQAECHDHASRCEAQIALTNPDRCLQSGSVLLAGSKYESESFLSTSRVVVVSEHLFPWKNQRYHGMLSGLQVCSTTKSTT